MTECNKNTYNAEEIAVILGVSRSRAYMLLHSESGPPTLRIGKLLRVPIKSFWAWVDTQIGAGKEEV